MPPLTPTAELLLAAYAQGLFPMVDNRRRGKAAIDWYFPDPRGVIPLDGLHVPKSLTRVVRSGKFELRSDTQFERVMRFCAQPRSRENGTWMNEMLLRAYIDLFELGHAHSVEAWLGDELVGGLYGVHIGAAFFGESMFSRPELGGTNASKVCLVHLVDRLCAGGFTLLDTQFVNDHIAQFGAIEIAADAYLERLAEAVEGEGRW